MDREKQELKGNIIQMDLRDIYRIFYSNTQECGFISVGHGSFSEVMIY